MVPSALSVIIMRETGGVMSVAIADLTGMTVRHGRRKKWTMGIVWTTACELRWYTDVQRLLRCVVYDRGRPRAVGSLLRAHGDEGWGAGTVIASVWMGAGLPSAVMRSGVS